MLQYALSFSVIVIVIEIVIAMAMLNVIVIIIMTVSVPVMVIVMMGPCFGTEAASRKTPRNDVTITAVAMPQELRCRTILFKEVLSTPPPPTEET